MAIPRIQEELSQSFAMQGVYRPIYSPVSDIRPIRMKS